MAFIARHGTSPVEHGTECTCEDGPNTVENNTISAKEATRMTRDYAQGRREAIAEVVSLLSAPYWRSLLGAATVRRLTDAIERGEHEK